MKVFDTPAPISVDLEIGCGDIRIVASDRVDTAVEVRPSNPNSKDDVALAEATQVELAGGRVRIGTGLRIKAVGWKQWLPWKGRESVDIRIELPAGSDVRGEATIAALNCTGRLGECRYTTSMGDIRVEHGGPLQLKTGGGKITVEHASERADVNSGTGAVRIGRIDGAAVVKNGNGDTWIEEAAGDLQVNAACGTITVDHAGASVMAKSASGDIRLGQVARGTIVAETGHGRIEIGVCDGVAAWLDIDTHYGAVRSDLEAARGPEPGEDTVEIRATTPYGDIIISRRPAISPGKETP